MEPITKTVWSYLEGHPSVRECDVAAVRQGHGFLVNNYRDLIEKIADLSFRNPEYILFYRGQDSDYREPDDQGIDVTTLYPKLFRSPLYDRDELLRRFKELGKADRLLADRYDFDHTKKIRTYRVLRWAILQHYEICSTPFLDLTHSIRVACSFAHNSNTTEEAFVYVLGLPQISGSVTASSEHGVQVIRLLSICPPVALRPHYQEGYVVGEFPTIGYREKLEYERREVDFGQRLIAKFRIPRQTDFWEPEFQPIPNDYLYPNLRDRFYMFSQELKAMLSDG